MQPKEMLEHMALACGGYSQIPDRALAFIVRGHAKNQGGDREELIRGLAEALEDRMTDDRTNTVEPGNEAAGFERHIRRELAALMHNQP